VSIARPAVSAITSPKRQGSAVARRAFDATHL
jgi:hypothetical protein